MFPSFLVPVTIVAAVAIVVGLYLQFTEDDDAVKGGEERAALKKPPTKLNS